GRQPPGMPYAVYNYSTYWSGGQMQGAGRATACARPRSGSVHALHASANLAEHVDEVLAEAFGEEDLQAVERAVDADILDTAADLYAVGGGSGVVGVHAQAA